MHRCDDMMRIEAGSRHVNRIFLLHAPHPISILTFGNASTPSRYLNSGGLEDGLQKPLPIIEAIIGAKAFIGCGATSFPLTMRFVEGSRKSYQKPFPITTTIAWLLSHYIQPPHNFFFVEGPKRGYRATSPLNFISRSH